jgi:hypothetical protein
MAMTRAAQRTLAIPLYDEGAPDNLKTGLTPTVTVSLDGGAFAAATNSATELGTTGVYALTLTADEMDADVVTVKVTASGACNQVLALVTDQSLAALATAAALATIDDFLDTEVAAIKAKTDTIGSSTVIVVSPVATSGDISLIAGDDYYATDGREFAWASTGWPDLSGATVTWRCGTLDIVCTVIDAGTATQTVRLELSAANTATLAARRNSFDIEAVLASTHKATLIRAVVTAA